MIIFNKASSQLMKSALILMATSSLFACGQSNTSASDNSGSTQTEGAAVSSKVTEIQAQNTPMITTSVNNPDLLKNVSAMVYKDVNCDCCEGWIDHAQSNGLSATAEHPKDLASFKDYYGVPNEMRSCHTVVTTDDYVFEGHVPAKYMAQFLENTPIQAMGLAVPGMPVGSPGMEYQDKFEPYQIMQLNKDGTTQVYADIDSVQQQL